MCPKGQREREVKPSEGTASFERSLFTYEKRTSRQKTISTESVFGSLPILVFRREGMCLFYTREMCVVTPFVRKR